MGFPPSLNGKSPRWPRKYSIICPNCGYEFSLDQVNFNIDPNTDREPIIQNCPRCGKIWSISSSLAGGPTTDAPPPEGKKKKPRGR